MNNICGELSSVAGDAGEEGARCIILPEQQEAADFPPHSVVLVPAARQLDVGVVGAWRTTTKSAVASWSALRAMQLLPPCAVRMTKVPSRAAARAAIRGSASESASLRLPAAGSLPGDRADTAARLAGAKLVRRPAALLRHTLEGGVGRNEQPTWYAARAGPARLFRPLPRWTGSVPFDSRARRFRPPDVVCPENGIPWLLQGLTFTKLFAKLFSKKEMRILMVRAPST